MQHVKDTANDAFAHAQPPRPHAESSSRSRGGLVWFAVGDFAAKAAGVLVLSQVSRWFAPVEAEAFVLAQTVTVLLIAAGDLGFRVLGTRHVALAESPAQVAAIARTIQRRRLTAAVVVGLPLTVSASLLLSRDPAVRLLLMFLGLCWLPYFLGHDWALLSLRDYKRLTWARLSQIAVVLLATAASTWGTLGPYCLGAGYALGFVAQWWVSARGLPRVESAPIARSEAKPEWASVRASIVLAVALGANALFHVQEVLLSGYLLGSRAAATFSAALRLILTACSLGWLATQYLSPGLASAAGVTRARQLSYAGPLFLWGLLVMVGTLLTSEIVGRLVYADAIQGVPSALRALAPLLPLDAVSALLGLVLVMQGRGRAAVISTFAGLFGSGASFVVLHALGTMDGAALPITAKYVGYLTLLTAQIHFAFLRAPSVPARLEAP